MTPLLFNVLNELTLAMATDDLVNRVTEKINGLRQQHVGHPLWQEAIPNDEPVQCTCCGWQGKKSETKKRYLFLEHATELELFCQKCSSYLGFLPVEVEEEK